MAPVLSAVLKTHTTLVCAGMWTRKVWSRPSSPFDYSLRAGADIGAAGAAWPRARRAVRGGAGRGHGRGGLAGGVHGRGGEDRGQLPQAGATGEIDYNKGLYHAPGETQDLCTRGDLPARWNAASGGQGAVCDCTAFIREE